MIVHLLTSRGCRLTYRLGSEAESKHCCKDLHGE